MRVDHLNGTVTRDISALTFQISDGKESKKIYVLADGCTLPEVSIYNKSLQIYSEEKNERSCGWGSKSKWVSPIS